MFAFGELWEKFAAVSKKLLFQNRLLRYALHEMSASRNLEEEEGEEREGSWIHQEGGMRCNPMRHMTMNGHMDTMVMMTLVLPTISSPVAFKSDDEIVIKERIVNRSGELPPKLRNALLELERLET